MRSIINHFVVIIYWNSSVSFNNTIVNRSGFMKRHPYNIFKMRSTSLKKRNLFKNRDNFSCVNRY